MTKTILCYSGHHGGVWSRMRRNCIPSIFPHSGDDIYTIKCMDEEECSLEDLVEEEEGRWKWLEILLFEWFQRWK